MGYYTDFSITIKGEFDKKEMEEKIEEVTDYCFDEHGNRYHQNCKWYDNVENMTELSKFYPNNLFTVDGDGEENGDVWRRVYHNGRQEDIQVETIYADSDLEAEFDTHTVVEEILKEEG